MPSISELLPPEQKTHLVDMTATLKETITLLHDKLDRWPTEDEVFMYIDGDTEERQMILEEREYGEGQESLSSVR